MDSVILCYASGDELFARELAGFLEINLPLAVSLSEGVVAPDLDLMEAVELALSAEVALVLLSPLSVPKVWNRKIWEPLFFRKSKEYQTLLGFVLVGGCAFPELLRKEHFFDASGSNDSNDALAAARRIKRWLLQPAEAVGPAVRLAPELEEVRRAVADRPGTAAEIPVELAEQFAVACSQDFEAVYRFDCRGRSRAGIAGDIGSALGLLMSGTLEENRVVLSEWCATHRVLFILAGVSAGDRDFATPGGRSSVIFIGPLVDNLPGHIPSGAADAVRRFEQTLYGDPEAGLRLGWTAANLLKTQGRFAEVLEVLDQMAGAARNSGDTNAVLRIEREQFWIHIYQGRDNGRILELPDFAQDEQLTLPFAENAD
jgi:hypothetical protein